MTPSTLLLAAVFTATCSAFLMSKSRRRIPVFERSPFGIEDVADDRHRAIQSALRRIEKLQAEGSLLRIHNAVKLASSSIAGAGQGMFALQNIKAGTLIGYFPVHAIGVDFDDDGAVWLATTEQDQQYFDNESTGSSSNYVQYLIGSRRLRDADFGSNRLFIDVNPNGTIGEGWIGHYINDGATVISNSEEGMLDYYAASRQRKNCVHIPFGPSPILATVTTRKVKKGEELFTSYGCSYWLDDLLIDGEMCANITEAVQLQAKISAQDLFDAMILARTTYAKLQAELEETFLTRIEIE